MSGISVEARDGLVEQYVWRRMFVLIIASGILIVDEREIWFWKVFGALRASYLLGMDGTDRI